MKRSLIIILILLIDFNLYSQANKARKESTLYGNWNFKYLLIDNKIKIWELEADTINFDFMNIYINKEENSFSVFGTLITKMGKATIADDYLQIKTEDSEDIIPKDSLTDYRKNIDWSRKFFEGKCNYHFENDSVLELFKMRDSVLVFRRLAE